MRSAVAFLVLGPTLLAACLGGPTADAGCTPSPDADDDVTARDGTSRFTLTPAAPILTPATNLSMVLRLVNEDCFPFEYRQIPTFCGGSVWRVGGEAFVMLVGWNHAEPAVYVHFSHSCGVAINSPTGTVAPGAAYEQEILWDGGVPMHVIRDGEPVAAGTTETVWIGPGTWALPFGFTGSWDASGQTNLTVEATEVNRDSPLTRSGCDVLAHNPAYGDDRRWTDVTVEANRTQVPLGTTVRFWVNLTLVTDAPGCYLLAGHVGLRVQGEDESFFRHCVPNGCGVGAGDAILIVAPDDSVDVRLVVDWTGPDEPGTFGLNAQLGILTQVGGEGPAPATFEWT